MNKFNSLLRRLRDEYPDELGEFVSNLTNKMLHDMMVPGAISGATREITMNSIMTYWSECSDQVTADES